MNKFIKVDLTQLDKKDFRQWGYGHISNNDIAYISPIKEKGVISSIGRDVKKIFEVVFKQGGTISFDAERYDEIVNLLVNDEIAE